MNNWHINNQGDVGRCSAKKGGCPFGGENEHYSTSSLAREAFERDMERDNPSQKALNKMNRINIKAKEEMLYEEFKDDVENAPVELLKIAIRHSEENYKKQSVTNTKKSNKEIYEIISGFAKRYGMDYKTSWAFKVNLTPKLSQPREIVASQIKKFVSDMKNQIEVVGQDGNAEFILSRYEDNTVLHSLVVNPETGESKVVHFNYSFFGKREKETKFNTTEEALDYIYDGKVIDSYKWNVQNDENNRKLYKERQALSSINYN